MALAASLLRTINALTLCTSDMASSCAFYSHLGLTPTFGGPDSSFTTFSVNAPVTADNNVLHINLMDAPSYAPVPPQPGAPGGWGRAVIFVDDVDALHSRLSEAGIEAAAPCDAPWGERYFHVLDPDGHELSFATPDYSHPRWSASEASSQALDESLEELRQEQSEAQAAQPTDAESPGGLVVKRTVRIDIGSTYFLPSERRFVDSPASWRDVTSAVAESLPPLPHALATISVPDDSACRLVVIDPSLLEVGPAEVVAPNQLASIALGVRDGVPLLPHGARLVLLNNVDVDGNRAVEMSLSVTIEAAEPLLTSSPSLSGGASMAQAALRTALAAHGIAASDIEAIEKADSPTAAGKVLESFVTKEHRPEALLPAARRAAHHIGHLLREEAAERASYLRNNDAAVAAREEVPAHPLTLILDNVRSAYNVGSLFRTADTARCKEIVTCGFTPHPPHPKLAKTAFGALDSVPTRHEESTLHAVREMQKRGVKVYAMETTSQSINYCSGDKGGSNIEDVLYPREGGVALVLGNEQIGVDTNVMAAVDGLIEIPTFGLKNSLNVASAGAIVVYEVLRQWGALGGGGEEEASVPPQSGGALIRGE